MQHEFHGGSMESGRHFRCKVNCQLYKRIKLLQIHSRDNTTGNTSEGGETDVVNH